MFIASIHKHLHFFLVRSGIIIFLMMLFLSIPIFSASASSSPILITEINYAGSTMPNGCKTDNSAQRCGFDKWIELTNVSSQSVNLSGWSLRLRQSAAANDNLTLPATLIPSGGTFLIAYYEINFSSALQASGAAPNYYSGKIRNISNMANKTVAIELKDASGTTVQPVFLSPTEISAFELEMQAGSKHSIELAPNGNWAVSLQAFFEQNFGTPLPLFFLNPTPPQADAETAPLLNFEFNFSPIYIYTIIEDIPITVQAPVVFEFAAQPSIIEIPQLVSFESAIIPALQMQANPILTPSFSGLPVATVVPRALPLPVRFMILSSYFWQATNFLSVAYSHSLPYLLFIGLAMVAETVRTKTDVSFELRKLTLQLQR